MLLLERCGAVALDVKTAGGHYHTSSKMYAFTEKKQKNEKTLNNVKEEASGLHFLVHLIQHNLNFSAAKPN